MKSKSIHWLVLFSALLCLAGSIVLESVQTRRNLLNQSLRDFQLRLSEKKRFLAEDLKKAANRLSDTAFHDSPEYSLPRSEDYYTGKGILLLAYHGDSLAYWSDNLYNVPSRFSRGHFHSGIVLMGNAWLTPQVVESGRWRLVGLILVKHQYPYENKFLKNDFQEDFRLPSTLVVGPDRMEGYRSFIVSGPDGKPLFVINHKPGQRFEQWEFSFPTVLFSFFLFFLFVFFRLRVKEGANIRSRMAWLAFFVAVFGLLRTLMVHFHWPGSVYGLSIFNPAHFAASRLLPSLGDLLIDVFGVSFLIYNIGVEWLTDWQLKGGSLSKMGIRFLLLLSLMLAFVFMQSLFASLVLDSDITFEARNVIELSVYSFAGLLSIGLLLMSFGIFAAWLLPRLFAAGPSSHFYLSLFLASLGGALLMHSLSPGMNLILLVFPLSFLVLLFYTNKPHTNFSLYVAYIIIASFYVLLLVDRMSLQKESERGRVLAMSLSTEHDPVAELMLDGMADRIRNDSVLRKHLFESRFRMDELFDYIRKKYFSGYWGKYDLQVTVCNGLDSLLVQPDNKWIHCYTFFDELVRNNGFALADSGFYFLDNRNGRISYFCRLPFSSGARMTTLHLQLDSKPVSGALGYPELLMDQKMMQNAALQGYSYAKYYKGDLTTQNGDYPYSLSGKEFEGAGEFYEKTGRGYNHLVYNPDDSNRVILSKPMITAFQRAVAFSCIFVFYFVIVVFLLLLAKPLVLRGGWSGSFRNRIQYSMIVLLMLSLFLVGGGSIYFSIRQYQDKHKAILREKMQSVYMELSQELQHETKLEPSWSGRGSESLEDLLRNFSNVFYTDINLFSTHGELLATSRPEIFENELTGTRMNREAFREMNLNQKAEYIHPEQIGSLTYLSAYVPFLNNQGKVLAYLNLPYFTRQNMLAGEISNLVLAFINVYLLLTLLSVSLAVFISRRITLPLRMIQEKIGRVKLGHEYVKIQYSGMDELAGLVEEYNRMLEELEESADKLARSERETAWREMARQIAHEIKNPLTPMKLSVQHLQRAWEDKSPRFDELLRKLTQTLSEQIDNLSHIASEFSSFATLPKNKLELINLVEITRHTLSLYEQSDNLSITLSTGGLEEAWVRSDKEQISRALINLVKNGMQAIEEGKPGIIRIGLKKEGGMFLLSVEDNGTGIPDELKEKMFQPNFTTKSAGMGLGLAIVKRIAESSGGRIWFETQSGLGTQFFIELPEARGSGKA